MRALLTGATGTVGRRLVASLAAERPRVLSRVALALALAPASRERAATVLRGLGDADVVPWDGRSAVPAGAFDGIDAVVHLAGEPVAEGRWTDAKKAAIRDSRVLGTRALVESMRSCATPPRVLVCASAVGFYGDRGDEELHESSPPGTGFLPEVCVAWEREAERFASTGTRVVRLRIGIVLDKEGGALPRMATPFRLGLGGPIGDGKQWLPWVHVDDVVGLALHAFTHGVSGAINAVAPHPVRQAKFAKALAGALGRPSLVRTPKFALRAAFGEMADVILASQRVIPLRANASGYTFRHPTLEAALRDLAL